LIFANARENDEETDRKF